MDAFPTKLSSPKWPSQLDLQQSPNNLIRNTPESKIMEDLQQSPSKLIKNTTDCGIEEDGVGWEPGEGQRDYITNKQQQQQQQQRQQQRQQQHPLAVTKREVRVTLTLAQQKVVDLAVQGKNIFLTGLTGSGKTTVLKEIIQNFQEMVEAKQPGGRFQVVAPTGLGALPLGGKTIHAFAGWDPESFPKGIDELLSQPNQCAIKAIQNLDVFIIKDVSMVENDFLERLSRLFQSVLANEKAFGGVQVIMLGDFYQLPPFRPFNRCRHCGSVVSRRASERSDLWAFKANVWESLKLKHVQLEQIHQRKDDKLQEILSKMRNGIPLSDSELQALIKEKPEPRKNGFATRLMSNGRHAWRFNANGFAALPQNYTIIKTWKAITAIDKYILKDGLLDCPVDPNKVKEYQDSFRGHRLPSELSLKRGARVILLDNLDYGRGLVSGLQGVVMGFVEAPWEVPPTYEGLDGPYKEFRYETIVAFQRENGGCARPLVHFANGERVIVTSVAQAGIRGIGKRTEQNVVTKTQLPLALGWALSIQESQGMALDYIEICPKDIVESNHVYAALSRATDLNSLKLTGFNKRQLKERLKRDPEVVEFYANAKWEKL